MTSGSPHPPRLFTLEQVADLLAERCRDTGHEVPDDGPAMVCQACAMAAAAVRALTRRTPGWAGIAGRGTPEPFHEPGFAPAPQEHPLRRVPDRAGLEEYLRATGWTGSAPGERGRVWSRGPVLLGVADDCAPGSPEWDRLLARVARAEEHPGG